VYWIVNASRAKVRRSRRSFAGVVVAMVGSVFGMGIMDAWERDATALQDIHFLQGGHGCPNRWDLPIVNTVEIIVVVLVEVEVGNVLLQQNHPTVGALPSVGPQSQ
jgi:hypothetical protein